MKVKRYVLFAYHEYYPNGGWNDFKGSFDTTYEAQEAIQIKVETRSGSGRLIPTYVHDKIEYDHYELIDLKTNQRVELFDKPIESYIHFG